MISATYQNDRCQKCAECCKHWSMWVTVEEAWRISHLNAPGLKIKSISDPDKHGLVRIIFDHPCRYLSESNGIYSCDIYDKVYRPNLCREYPKNFFHLFKDNIKVIEIESDGCPILHSMLWSDEKTRNQLIKEGEGKK